MNLQVVGFIEQQQKFQCYRIARRTGFRRGCVKQDGVVISLKFQLVKKWG